MSPQKQVTFGDLTITEYPIIMGANPACNGCPITIGWEPMGTHTRNLELYEYTRSQTRQSRRKLVIPVHKRSTMLLDAGYTQEQIIKRALEVAEIKNQREESMKDAQVTGFGKLSKGLNATFAKLNLGVAPKPTKTTVTARSA